jgi:hypothetical protein
MAPMSPNYTRRKSNVSNGKATEVLITKIPERRGEENWIPLSAIFTSSNVNFLRLSSAIK